MAPLEELEEDDVELSAPLDELLAAPEDEEPLSPDELEVVPVVPDELEDEPSSLHANIPTPAITVPIQM